VEANDREITINSWEPQLRSFSVGPGAAGDIRVKTFYYPHWTASAGDKLLPVRPSHDGVILISVPGEPTKIELQFREPTRAHIAAAVTALAWAVIIVVMLYPMP
jgi:hypothetical protein